MLSSASHMEPATPDSPTTFKIPQVSDKLLTQKHKKCDMQQTKSNQSVLNTLKLDKTDLIPDKHDDELVLYNQHPREIIFSHQFIQSEIERFDLVNEGCGNCNLLSRHFEDPRSNFDRLTEAGISWIQHPSAIMTSPFPNIKQPAWDPVNVDVIHPESRPRGFIHVKRICKKLDDQGEFIKIAKAATASVLRNLKVRPLAVDEVNYKLR